MRTTRRAATVFALLISMAVARPCFAQSTDAGAAPVLTPSEMEEFLLTGEIIATKRARKGVTDARQVTLSDGRMTHDAQLQDVDIALPIFNVGPRHSEVNFKDTYRYNIAGYRLALLLGLDNVPMSVERRVDRKPVAMTWWIDDVIMDEGDRQKKKTAGPDPSRTAMQIHTLRVFDELIQNRDRNAGNILWTADWKMWMIDHTRAFRLGKDLLKAEGLERIEATLFRRLKELTAPTLAEAAGHNLTKYEVDALMARRDLIVERFEGLIAQRGEVAVLFTMPSPDSWGPDGRRIAAASR